MKEKQLAFDKKKTDAQFTKLQEKLSSLLTEKSQTTPFAQASIELSTSSSKVFAASSHRRAEFGKDGDKKENAMNGGNIRLNTSQQEFYRCVSSSVIVVVVVVVVMMTLSSHSWGGMSFMLNQFSSAHVCTFVCFSVLYCSIQEHCRTA